MPRRDRDLHATTLAAGGRDVVVDLKPARLRRRQTQQSGMYMPFVIGIVLSLGVAILARGSGFGRDRAFYPTVLIVIASYYVLFAAISGSVSVALMESMVMVGFSTVAVMGFKSSPWILVIALIGHGVFDALHGKAFTNPGVPHWWPAFCFAYDVGAAGCLAWFSQLPRATSRMAGNRSPISVSPRQ